MKKRAPGEIMLKMVGVLFLVMGVFMAFGGAGSLALVIRGAADETVQQFMTETQITYGQMTAGGIISAVGGMIYLAAGIFGVKFGGRTEKAQACMVMAALLFAEIAAEIIYNYVRGLFQPFSIVSLAALPALYLWGAIRNKQAQGNLL